jgi:hypothetical protein
MQSFSVSKQVVHIVTTFRTYVLSFAAAPQYHVLVIRWLEMSHRLVVPVAGLDVEAPKLLVVQTGNLNWNESSFCDILHDTLGGGSASHKQH